MTDYKRAALLVMDFQTEIVNMLAGGGSREAVAKAVVAREAARAAGMPIVYVTVLYRAGHIDASTRNKRVAMLREQGRLREGTPGASIVPELAPLPGEPVVVKRRVSALAHTDMAALLSALQVDTLVLAGIATSGVVLSTVRQAADADYGIVVLADACADGDAEVHSLLTGKVFPAQTTVMSVAAFAEELAAQKKTAAR